MCAAPTLIFDQLVAVPTCVGVLTLAVPEPETIIEEGFEPQPQIVPSVFIAKAVLLIPEAISTQSVAVPTCMGDNC